MIHPDTELRFVNQVIGFGVFATRRIPKGTITWVHDLLDQAFTPEQVSRFEEPYQSILDKYTYVDSQGRFILCWDHSRFFNHSCEANCLGAGYNFEIAVRDIQPGEELTDDYGTLNLRRPFDCACGSPQCRAHIAPQDMEKWAESWDRSVRAAFALIPQVAQPLWPLLQEKAEIELALKNPDLIRSIRRNYYPA